MCLNGVKKNKFFNINSQLIKINRGTHFMDDLSSTYMNTAQEDNRKNQGKPLTIRMN